MTVDEPAALWLMVIVAGEAPAIVGVYRMMRRVVSPGAKVFFA